MCYTEIPCGHSGISRGAEPGCWHLSEGFTTLFSARSPPKNKICACDGIGRHARFRFSCSNACGFESLQAHHVVADFISFATTFYFKKSSLIHSVAPPFQIEPASLGFDLVLGADLKAGASKLFTLSTSEQAAYRLLRLFFKKSERAYSAAPPFQITTVLLGCDLVLGCRPESLHLETVRAFQQRKSPEALP